MDLIVKKVRRCNSKKRKEIKAIYFRAFKKEERMPFPMMILMSYLWNTEFLAFYDGDRLCGYIYLATIFRQTFIMFIGVNEEYRQMGYGSKILEIVKNKYKKNRITVSILPLDNPEVIDYEERVKRKNFYKKNGFEDTGYYMRITGIKEEILICNGKFNKSKFVLFFMLYSNLVMIPKIWKIDNDKKSKNELESEK